jgi:tetrapyrrole methylase family protein/MazG family protein
MDQIKRLQKLMAKLRSKNGCPWDRKQTHQTLKPYLIEEAHEVLDAIDSKNSDNLREELGDLLLQVVFHSQLSGEKKRFNFNDVAETISNKLLRRHPHVFGKSSRKMDSILKKWEELKREEKPERQSALDGLPKSLPALLKAQRMQDKVSRYGFLPQSTQETFKPIEDEWKQFQSAKKRKNRKKMETHLGEMMFRLTWLAHLEKLNAETALSQTNKEFEKQFQRWEKQTTANKLPPLKKKISS